MGFGYLFVGTVLTVNVVAHGFTDLIAYILLLMGMMTLKDYGTRLKSAYYAAWPLLAVGAIELFVTGADFLEIDLAALIGFGTTNESLSRDAGLLNQIALLVFTFLLLRGLRTLAQETDSPSLEVRAFRNQIFAVLYHVPMAFLNIPFTAKPLIAAQNYMFYPFLLFGFIYLILQAKLIFSYYMWICPEDDVEMERRPSRIPFLNKLYRISDKIDDKTVERKREERKEKAERQQNQKNRRKKK